MAPGPTSGEVRTRGWGHYCDVFPHNFVVSACSCRERVLRTPWRPEHLLPGSGTRALFLGRRRCRLGVWNQAKRLHGPRTAQGARITSPDLAVVTVAGGLRRSEPPEWTLSDRGERSPPERATGVDFKRPWRAVSAGAGHRSGLGRPWRAVSAGAGHLRGLGRPPLIQRDTLPDLAVGHRKPHLILERSPEP